MTVRETMYGILSTDATLIGLGYIADNVYANAAPDSPPEVGQVWMVLNWGEETPALRGQRGRSRVTTRALTLWVYDRERDYTTINAAIKRLMDLMEGIEQNGPVLCANWQGDGPDGYDDTYQAVFRNTTYTIVSNQD